MPTLRRTDFAWEFLRRNERYRRHASSGCAEARPWGLQFVADPSTERVAQDVYWRPEVAPTHVIWLRRAANDDGVRLDHVLDVTALRRTVDGVHVKLSGGLQAFVEGCEPSEPLAAIVPISGSFSAALKGVSDLERVLRGGGLAADLGAKRPRRWASRSRASIEAASTWLRGASRSSKAHSASSSFLGAPISMRGWAGM